MLGFRRMFFGVAADLIAALVAFATVSLSSEEPLKEDRLCGSPAIGRLTRACSSLEPAARDPFLVVPEVSLMSWMSPFRGKCQVLSKVLDAAVLRCPQEQ